MIHGYVKNPRLIMLIVVPANVDIATQEIIEMARELEPEGEKSLGVITKLDLVNIGTKMKVIDLIKGRVMEIKLG
jgi:replication fork clamp-binding protein CrfC